MVSLLVWSLRLTYLKMFFSCRGVTLTFSHIFWSRDALGAGVEAIEDGLADWGRGEADSRRVVWSL